MTSDAPLPPETLAAFQGDELRARVFWEKYALRDPDGRPLETLPSQMWSRVARGIASVEPDPQRRAMWEQEFLWLLSDFRFLPGGRILHAVGQEASGRRTVPINCFVIPIKEDSLSAIYEAAREMAITYSRGGGVGTDISILRPKGSPVHNAARTSTGAVSFMELFSLTTGLIGQCLAEGTPVLTSRGWTGIEHVRPDDRVWTHQGWRHVTYCFPSRTVETFLLRTRRGYTLRVSADHKMAVVRNGHLTLVPLRDLAVGSTVLLLRGQGASDAAPQPLRSVPYIRDPYNNSNRLVTISQPAVLTPDLAYWLGFYTGNGSNTLTYADDGAVKGVGIEISVRGGRHRTTERLRTLTRTLFGLDAHLEAKSGEECVRLRIHSTWLYEWLQANGLAKARAVEARIPEAVRASSDTVVAAFLAGLFDADGSPRGRKGGYRFTTASPGLASDIQLELLRLGIVTTTHVQTRSTPGWATLYTIAVVGRSSQKAFLTTVGPHGHRTGEFLASRDSVVTPWTIRDLGITRTRRTSYIPAAPQKITVATLERYAAEHALPGHGASLLVEDTIATITPIGPTTTYDIEVEDTHKFSAGGLYVSNSGRRGALMITIRDDHPDVLDFCRVKRDLTSVRYANISVLVSDAFMRAALEDRDWMLRYSNPDAGVHVERPIRARELWDELIRGARDWAEPGCLFIDTARRRGTTEYNGMQVLTTNPCGEQWLDPYNNCCLGSLNLLRVVLRPFAPIPPDENIDWPGLARATRTAIRFLDNVVSYADPLFPLESQREAARRSRRVGLGITGLGDMLAALRLPYDSPEALELVERLARFIMLEAYGMSCDLAREKGPFPAWDPDAHLRQEFFADIPDDLRERIRRSGLRNAALLTVPPVGSGSALAGVSSGLEPIFSLAYVRRSESLSREYFTVIHPLAALYLASVGEDLPHLAEERNPADALQDRLPPFFVTAHHIDPLARVRLQAAVARYVDNSVSTTVNLPREATTDTVERVYRLAWELGCKGITVYREGSREGILLTPEEARRRHQLVALAERVTAIASPIVPSLGASGRAPDEQIEHAVRALAELVAQRADQRPLPQLSGPIRERPRALEGVTYRIPMDRLGTLFVTVNDLDGEPFEVFCRLGKAGADTEADAEAIGRLLSFSLRLHGPVPRSARLEALAEQLQGIGGSIAIGFGPHRVRSIPDGIAQALRQHLMRSAATQDGTHPLQDPRPTISTGNICPRCQRYTLVTDHGCAQCECGYKEC